MTKLNGTKTSLVLLLLAATVIATPAQTYKVVFSFDLTNGSDPYSPLVQGRDGNFYGTTSAGGTQNGGTVFKITPSGALTTIYNFCMNSPCLFEPFAGLVLATDGNFYGTAYSGGASNKGGVFRITPDGKFTPLYSFCSQVECSDGAEATASLVEGIDGNLYGTTYGVTTFGEPETCGTIFKITPSGSLTALYRFTGSSDGCNPYTQLTQGKDGDFYGTTYNKGTVGCHCGSVFKVTSQGKLTALHDFNLTDGAYPAGALIVGNDGNFYGTTSYGGSDYGGTVYKMTPEGTVTTLYNFVSVFDPMDPVALGTDGNFYGTTLQGGNFELGDIFQLTPGGVLTNLYYFLGGDDGYIPYGALLQATGGMFYSTTFGGGTSQNCPFYYGEIFPGCGTVYSLDMGLGPFVAFVRPAGKIGQLVQILGQGFQGTTEVSFNGVPTNFTVVSDTFLGAAVPAGATTGYVSVTTPSSVLTSNARFYVIP